MYWEAKSILNYQFLLFDTLQKSLFAFQIFLVALEHGCIILQPEFTQFCIPYFMTPEEVEYILKAIHFVADQVWKFMPQYDLCTRTGDLSHNLIKLAIDKYFHLTPCNPLVPVKRSNMEDILNQSLSNVLAACKRHLYWQKTLRPSL